MNHPDFWGRGSRATHTEPILAIAVRRGMTGRQLT